MVVRYELVRRIDENRRLIDDLIKPEIFPAVAAPVPPPVALNDMLIADATPVWTILTGPAAQGEILVAGAAPFTQTWATVDLLSLTHGDTTPQAVSRGSIIYGDAGPTWNELVIGPATNFLRSDGVDAAWSPILVTDLPAHNLLSATHGDTVVQAVSRGSLVYGDATPDWNELVIGALSTHLESDGADVTWQANITMADDTWIGLGPGTARILFDDTPAGDNIRFENCTHVGIDNLLEHNGDLDTYLIFSPDYAGFRVGNVDMLQMQELAAAQDNVTINATQADVDFVVEALALANAFWVEGLTGAIVVTGPSLTVPDDWWEGLGPAAGRVVFDSTPAPDQMQIADADLNFVTAAHGIIHVDGVALGSVLRADGTRYVPASAVATVPLPPVAQNDMLIADAVPEWSVLTGPAAQGDVLIAGAAPLTPAWGTVFTANMTFDDGVLDSPSLGFVGASNDQALLHFDDTARSLVITLEDDKAEALRIIDDGGADDYFTIVSTNAQREVVINQDGVDIDTRIEASGISHALFVQASDGYIGAGEATPGAKLHVNSVGANIVAIFESTDAFAQLYLKDDTTTDDELIRRFGDITSFYAGAIEHIQLKGDGEVYFLGGNVGIADSTPTEGRLSIINNVADNGAILYLYRDQSVVNQSGFYMHLDNVADDEAAMTIRHDGTGDLFQLFDGAVQVVDIDNTGHLFLNSTTGLTGHTLFVQRALASGSTDNAVVSFTNTAAGDDQSVLWITQYAPAIGLDVAMFAAHSAAYFSRDVDAAVQPVVVVVQDHATAATPVVEFQQDDISEGFINFVGSDRGVIGSGTSSLASVRVELGGVVYRLALFLDA